MHSLSNRASKMGSQLSLDSQAEGVSRNAGVTQPSTLHHQTELPGLPHTDLTSPQGDQLQRPAEDHLKMKQFVSDQINLKATVR